MANNFSDNSKKEYVTASGRRFISDVQKQFHYTSFETKKLLKEYSPESETPSIYKKGAQKIDLEFIEWLGQSGVPFAIVFTKADKLSATKVAQNVEAYKKVLLETWEELPPIFITSAEKKQGRDEVLDYIEDINKTLVSNQ